MSGAEEDPRTAAAIAAAVRSMHRKIDDDLLFALGGATGTSTTASNTGGTFNVERMLRDWRVLTARARRESITFVVIALHPSGRILCDESPSEGSRFEMSWTQAQELHRQWPMKLSKVLAPDMAEFVPISTAFPDYAPVALPPPPWPMADFNS